MKKRVFSLFLVCVALVSTTVFGCIDVWAVETAMTAAEWAYLFELGSAAAGVTYSGSEEAAVFEEEWVVYIRNKTDDNGVRKYFDVHDRYAKGLEQSALNDVGEDGKKFSTKMLESIVDFLSSNTVSTGYGTVNFSFRPDFVGRIMDALGLELNYIISEMYSSNSYGIAAASQMGFVHDFSFSFLRETDMDGIFIDTYMEDVFISEELGVRCFFESNGSLYIMTIRGDDEIFTYKPFRILSYIRDDVYYDNFGLLENLPYPDRALDVGSYFRNWPYLVFENREYAQNWLVTGIIDGTLHVPDDLLASFVFADSFPGVQAKGELAVPFLGDRFEIPETAAAAAIISKIRKAETEEELINALENAGVKVGTTTDVDGSTDEDVDIVAYPWLSNIINSLTKILNAVKAIPTQFTDFFTVNIILVTDSFVGLKDAFYSRFEPIVALGGLFGNMSYGLDSGIPVFKMAVPPSLYGVVGDTEIIVFDLRGYEDYVAIFRTFVQVSVWITAAFVILDLFDVKFHVG